MQWYTELRLSSAVSRRSLLSLPTCDSVILWFNVFYKELNKNRRLQTSQALLYFSDTSWLKWHNASAVLACRAGAERGCSRRVCCVSDLIKPLLLWICCETRWCFTRSHAFPEREHRWALWCTTSCRPALQMDGHPDLQTWLSPQGSLNPVRLFSSAQYFLNIRFLQWWFCWSCFEMSNFAKCCLEHALLYMLNTLHAHKRQWEIRDFLTFSLLSLHETKKKFSIETVIITCAQYILLCIIRIKLIDNDIVMNSLQDASVQYLRKLVKSG